jgi:hypothetical protein
MNQEPLLSAGVWESLPNVRAVFAAFLTTILFSISVISHRSAKLIGGTFWRLTCATLFLAFGLMVGIVWKGMRLKCFLGDNRIGIGDVALFQALLIDRASLLHDSMSNTFGADRMAVAPGKLSDRFCGVTILVGVGIALRQRVSGGRREVDYWDLAALIAALGRRVGGVEQEGFDIPQSRAIVSD